MSLRRLSGITSGLILVVCWGCNSVKKPDVDANRSKELSNDSSTQMTSPEYEREVKAKERTVYASLLNKVVYGEKGGSRTEDKILIYKRTISRKVTSDLFEKKWINAEALRNFVSKNAQPIEVPKALEAYFNYEFIDNDLSGVEAKFPKSRVAIGLSRIGFTRDFREAFLFIEINNYVNKEVLELYYKVTYDDRKFYFEEVENLRR